LWNCEGKVGNIFGFLEPLQVQESLGCTQNSMHRLATPCLPLGASVVNLALHGWGAMLG